MKIIFAGTPAFAATALDALISEGHEIVLTLTQPDRQAGRGMKKHASPVKQLAESHNLPLRQPASLKDFHWHEFLDENNADVMVVAAYGLILPKAVLTIPRYGCLNIHASLLPRWRGAAPIHRAILAGDTETGITIMQMDEGLDTGAMLLKKNTPIADDDTTQTLHDKLSILGAQAIIDSLNLLAQQKLPPVQQDESQACYAAKINKKEAKIDWKQPAENIERMIRAFNPSPGAYTIFHGNSIKIWQACKNSKQSNHPGKILAIDPSGILVACGSGSLKLEVVQKAGSKRLNAAAFITGFDMTVDDHFDTHENLQGSTHD